MHPHTYMHTNIHAHTHRQIFINIATDTLPLSYVHRFYKHSFPKHAAFFLSHTHTCTHTSHKKRHAEPPACSCRTPFCLYSSSPSSPRPPPLFHPAVREGKAERCCLLSLLEPMHPMVYSQRPWTQAWKCYPDAEHSPPPSSCDSLLLSLLLLLLPPPVFPLFFTLLSYPPLLRLLDRSLPHLCSQSPVRCLRRDPVSKSVCLRGSRLGLN